MYVFTDFLQVRSYRSLSCMHKFKVHDVYCVQMVARLKTEIRVLKDELCLVTGHQRTDELSDEEKAGFVFIV